MSDIGGSAGMPEAARALLERVVEHHRDLDEAPIFFRYEYLPPHSSGALQDAYDQALELVAEAVVALADAERARLSERVASHIGRFVIPDQVIASLELLSEAERLGHAWAGSYIQGAFFNLDRYLDPAVPQDSRVLATYPELAHIITAKDCLLPIGGDVAPGHAWVTFKGHEIHPHPCLRRGYTAKVHFGLLEKLWEQLDAGLLVKVAIDHFRMCARGQLGHFIEADAWFGAPFSADKLDDKYAVGATLHARTTDASPFDKAGLLTEFRWHVADGKKTLEVEELPVPREADGPMICRYVHAIRDLSTKQFIHLDGSVTIYDREAYSDRYRQATDHKLPKVWAGRKVKLFRIDQAEGPTAKGIADDAWANIIVTFFRGNELVLEYFDGRSFAEIYRAKYKVEHPFLGSRPDA